MATALTNRVSDRLVDCELTHLEREPIHVDRARAQHEAYCTLLESLGLAVVRLEVNQNFPDSVFVEDTTVVVDEIAVMTTMGAASRKGEVKAMAEVLARYRPLAFIPEPARIEGGDVLRIGRRLFVGLTTRTDAAGVAALADILRPHGYQVLPVPMKKALHLKSTVTALDDETLIVHRPAVDIEPFAGFRLVDVPEEEPGAANILRLPKAIVIHQGYRRTIDLLNRLGYPLAAVDVSELIKAESGVTCSSVIL